jgi:lipid-A-disaccharide synthase
MPHIFICTGEISGDLQASYLIQSLIKERPDLEITAVGGARMEAAGAKLLHKTTSISSIGFVEALPFIGPALWTEWKIRRFLAQASPDLAVLVDYIGVNSRICTLLNQNQIPTVYYIAPQEWVWSQTPRLSYQLAQYVDLMLAIFPEEARYYQAKGAAVKWVGHPLIDILQKAPPRDIARANLGISEDQTAVMIFPASRQQELTFVAPVLFAAARQLQQQYPQVTLWVPLASQQFAEPLLAQARALNLNIHLLDTQDPYRHQTALAAADLVLAKSGTVNLETAILGIPQVVIYRLNPLTHWIGKKILQISIPFISPANLVLMRLVVPELLQDQAQPERIVREALDLLTNPERRRNLAKDYAELRLALGEPGVLQRSAQAILTVLNTVNKHR